MLPKRRCYLAAVVLLLIPSAVYSFPSLFGERKDPSLDKPSQSQQGKQQALAERFPGRIVFDSNRSGTFGIYSMRVDGSDLQTISDTALEELYPDVSTDGQWIVFARAQNTKRTAPADIWVVRPDGSEARLVAKNGTFPTFSTDGKRIYFERSRKILVQVEIDGSSEQEIFSFGRHKVVKPRVSPDGTQVAFISDARGRWNTWRADIDTGKAQHVAKGCEPTWYAEGDKLAWVREAGVKQGSGIYTFNISDNKSSELVDYGPPRGHEYFPTLAYKNRYLLYSSCREDEHSHITANYQIFVQDLETGERVRVTFDAFTNRWPKLLMTR